MKTAIATITLIASLLAARLTAADATPATISVEQEFQQADIQLAIEQYKKLRMAAFDYALKFQTETFRSDEQRYQLTAMDAQLRKSAEELRDTTIEKARAAAANAR